MIKTIKIVFGVIIIFLALGGFINAIRMGTGFSYYLGVLTPTVLFLLIGFYLIYSANKK